MKVIVTPLLTCVSCGGALQPAGNEMKVIVATGTALFRHSTDWRCNHAGRLFSVPITVLEPQEVPP